MILSLELEQQIGPFEQGSVTTDDGVKLLYQRFGSGPTVVFGNGIGVRYPGAVRQIEALRPTHSVLCWDYRGIGQSVMPDPARGDVSMRRHARDILALLDHLGVDRAAFIGWSMGVQVALEAFDLQPERMAGLVALLGTYGRPFHNAFPGPVAAGIEALFTVLGRAPAVAQGALDLAVALPELAFALLSRGLFVGPDADRDVFAANVRSVAGVDKVLYCRTMLALAEHDAARVLPRLSCPALVIAGEHDHITPPREARWMARSIAGDATYREVPRGTHFALIEQPARVNSWIVPFIERVLPPRSARAQEG